MLKKIQQTSEIKTWEGSIPVKHTYTLGIAGEKFFRTLKDKEKFLAAKCNKCGKAFIPAKTYCEECFVEIKEFLELKPKMYVKAFTEIHFDLEDKKLSNSQTVAFIEFAGASGGIIHKIKGTKDKIKIGAEVKPKFISKQKRTGSLNDIEYFEVG